MRFPDWTHTLQFRLTVGFVATLALTLFAVSGWAALSTRASIHAYASDLERFREESTWQLVNDVYNAYEDLSQVQYSLEQVGRLMSFRVAVIDEHGMVIADSHQSPLDSDGFYETEEERFKQRRRLRSVPLNLGDVLNGKLLFTEPLSRLKGPIFFHDTLHDKDGFLPRSSGFFGTPAISQYPLLINVDGVGRRIDDDGDDDELQYGVINEALRELRVEPQLSALEESFQRSILIAGAAAGLGGISILFLFTRRSLSPVRDLSNAARLLAKGDFEHRVNEGRKDELGQLAHTFNVMAAELKSVETNRRQMTADIAHELRTPLTNIRGYLEAIKDGVVEPESDVIDTLHKETVHLSVLVDDLQLLANAAAGALRLELNPDRLESVVQTAVEAFLPRAAEKGVEIRVETIDGPLPLVDIDHTRMAQVVGNLVENAMQHTEAHGLIEVRIKSVEDRSRVRLEVMNTGDGIPEEHLSRIFDQYYRVDPSRNRRTGGAGLGLTIVKRLVEAHGGEVSASSEFGKSATLSVEIPASSQAD